MLMKLLEALDERMNAFNEAMRLATEEFMANPSYALPDISEINHGLCEDWAMAVMKEFYNLEEKDFEDDPIITADDRLGHYFVEFRGKLYDAEVPSGVDDPRQFPLADRMIHGGWVGEDEF